MVKEQTGTQTQQLDPSQFQIEIISDSRLFNAMEREWDLLVQNAGIDHPFLSHNWLRTWWESFGRESELYIVAIRRDGELVGAAPMMRSAARLYGLKMDIVGSIYNPHTPRTEFIFSSGSCATEIYRLFWRAFMKSGCDLVVLRQFPSGSPTLTALEKCAAKDNWQTGRWTARPSPFIPLGCSYDEFFNRLKGGYRYNLRKRYERLGKNGAIDVEVITGGDGLREAISNGLKIEAAAWKGDRGTAILSDPSVTAFYTRLAQRESDLGRLRLSFLRVGGKRISFSYILRYQRALYGIKIGYDPEYHSYSPGNMLLSLILREACDDGLAEYDFLGIDDQWKLDWTKEARTHEWLFLFPNRVRSRLVHRLKFQVAPNIKDIGHGLLQMRHRFPFNRIVHHSDN